MLLDKTAVVDKYSLELAGPIASYESVEQVHGKFLHRVTKLNYSAIAKVCLTDTNTVEKMLNEFFA